MLSYLNAETGFIRAFANRGLLLIFLCALTRGGDQLRQGIGARGVARSQSRSVSWFSVPSLALLLLICAQDRGRPLVVAREVVLPKMNHLDPAATKASGWVFPLFARSRSSRHVHDSAVHPQRLCCPRNRDVAGYVWTRKFTDFSIQGGSPSTYCIHNLTDGMPWIYPPLQTYGYVACLGACFYLTYRIARNWAKLRPREVAISEQTGVAAVA